MPITTADIQTLEQHYRIDGPNVFDFIGQYSFLYAALTEAVTVIRAQFPDATLALEVDDWDADPAYHEIMVKIESGRNAQEAIARLDIIDNTWLFPNAERFGNRLNLHLR